MRADQLALQLYTVREACARDFVGTLRAVAELGYTAVELTDLYGLTPEQARSTFDELGLRAPAFHIGHAALEKDLGQIVSRMQTLGGEFVVVPWTPEEHRRSADAARAFAARFNEWGRALRAEGLRLAYHNHDFEFKPLEGSSFWEIFLAETDPALVELELDVCWVKVGGHDPAAIIAQNAQRAAIVHLKDVAPSGDRPFTAGEGTLDWDPILAAARAAGTAWYIVEEDQPRDPLDDVRRAREHMLKRAIGG